MTFKPDDFKGLKYNCHPVPETKNLLEAFPELAIYPEFSLVLEALDINKVLRYIIYTYDKKSPLLPEKNLIKRKMQACKLAGFELKDDKYPKLVEEMIQGYNLSVNRMICRYCRNQRDLSYSLLIAGMESFFDSINRLSTRMKEDDMDELNRRAVLYKHMEGMITSLEQNAQETFAGDMKLMYEADVIQEVETGKVKSFPEFISTLREEGTLQQTFKNL